MKKIFGNRLRELREMRNLSQEEFGERFEISKVTISGYERGMRTPSFPLLVEMADFLEVSTDYLLGRTDEKTPPNKIEVIKENARLLNNALVNMDQEEQERFFQIMQVAVDGIKSKSRP
ncbi:helix-turn-helix domain-containing protein [Brevibacillus sp. JB24b]|uniref:helix-turn-helix domain-containing protein n=1 Tax=Brevibacillus sp. JB24b TaxID=3422308 RepID=UPI003F6875E7